MRFVVRFDIPDFLIRYIGHLVQQYTIEHAEAEVRLNGCEPGSCTYIVSMLPDNYKEGRTNYSRVFLEMRMSGVVNPHWRTARYPGRLDFQRQVTLEEIDEP
ncbi:MAG TPA: hypothetical protein VMY98_07125 [Anaerolineae bacterium]|nr:hypothetical protein [Anaerolineae bacterium]